MEIDIGGFDYSNHAHLRDANNLLDNIIDDNGYNYDTVMDIGCGSGRVTSLIDCRLRCEQILAIDIDMKAIKFAEKNYPSPRIRYQISDISLPWDKLDPLIRKYENQVDLIISNRVLHWIEDKNYVIQNIFRLLKPGGMCYANITTLLDLFSDLTQDEREKFSELIIIPSETDQKEQFKNLFEKNQFKLHWIESLHLQQLYPKDEFRSNVLPYFPNLTKKYLIEKDPIKRNMIMASGLSDYVKNAFLRLYSREIIEANGIPDKYELTYGQIKIIAQK
ncbi:uncharacterized protein LOC113788597 [Dermatophagoides pteronyssinus]|uniref:Juvenile hormone acid O-methyltransferase-like n=2 Tax=Dermatophagoides pteronyssinus TaxID=6956 RepID=A0A6P6XM58_DERPT|nr:juvenile hormone acid O-methyltransferase-like [Dermatophagoides pteronyssinus]KAH9421386.1 hypothetical protein DERP_010523 [Dermatophagoides pteronyssinus]